MSDTKTETVLVVEDDAGVARLQRLRLERAGYTVRVATTADAALGQVRTGGVDLLVLDYRLNSAEDGLAFYARLKGEGHDLPVVMVTGYGDDATIVRALRAGVRDYIFKSPEYLDYLPEAVGRVLDQVRVRRELADSQALARGVLDSLSAHIAVLDPHGTIIAVNEAWDRFARANDGARACGVGANYLDVCRRATGLYSDEAPAVERGIRDVLDGALPSFVLEYPCPWLAEPRWFALQVTRLATARPGAVVAHTDITERRLAEEVVRESEARFRALADSAPVLIWVNGPAGCEFVNQSYLDFFGKTLREVQEARWAEYLHPEDAAESVDAYRRAAAAGARFEATFRFRRADGVYRWFKSVGLPRFTNERYSGHVGCSLDITDLREADRQRELVLADLRAKTDELKVTTQQLWQAARLAGVGELAASIAHELNNPLATVSLRVEGVLSKTPADDPRRKPLEIIEGEVERMARLVSNLLQFSRAGRDQVSTVDVCEELVKTTELTEHHLRKRQIVVSTEFAPAVPHIHADRQQLRQVFLNLFTNAADAMPSGGRLIVRVQPSELPGGAPAVAVEVADTGMGIPPDHLDRVSEAFFTTKEDGKGTGLGLAICKRIVHQHHGKLEIESTVGVGTTVCITLPVRAETNIAGLRVEPPALL